MAAAAAAVEAAGMAAAASDTDAWRLRPSFESGGGGTAAGGAGAGTGTGTGPAVAVLAAKLGHELAEVRHRALRSIRLKLSHQLVSLPQLAASTELLRNLLCFFNFHEDGDEEGVGASGLREEALELLRALAEDTTAAVQLQQMGAVDFMRHLRADSPPALHPLVDRFVDTLLREYHRPAPAHVALEHGGWIGSGESVPAERDWRPHDAFSSPIAPSSPLLHSLQLETHAVNTSFTSLHNAQPPEPTHETSTASPTDVTARIIDHASVLRVAHFDGVFTEEELKAKVLPAVELCQSDEQFLFELNVKVQLSNAVKVIRPALEELRDTAVYDFPPQAFIQHPALLENALSMLHTSGESGLDVVILQWLTNLLEQTQQAEKLASCIAFALPDPTDDESKSIALYNRPPDVCYPPAGRNLNNTISVLPAAHLIFTQLLRVLCSERLHMLTIPLLGGLLPYLAVAEHTAEPCSQTTVRLAAYHSAISQAVHFLSGANSPEDIRSNKDNISILSMPPPPSVLAVLLFAARLLEEIPPAYYAQQQLLPHGLAELIARHSANEYVHCCVPTLRAKVLEYLEYAKPEYFAAHRAVDIVQRALDAASDVAGDDIDARANAFNLLVDAAGHVQHSQDAGVCAKLLHMALTLLLTSAHVDGNAREHVNTVANLTMQLISRSASDIRKAAYRVLVDVTESEVILAKATALHTLVMLLSDTAIAHELLRHGIQKAETQLLAGQLILWVVESTPSEARATGPLFQWLPWVVCALGNGGRLSSPALAASAALLTRALCTTTDGDRVTSTSWQRMAAMLRGLFRASRVHRMNAMQELSARYPSIAHACEHALENASIIEWTRTQLSDPFGHCLSEAAASQGLIPPINNTNDITNPCIMEQRDVPAMLRTFLSTETDAVIRRSVLEQLSLCARDMDDDTELKQRIVMGLIAQLASWAAQSEAWGNASECMELNMDCIKLLEQLVARKVDVVCESGVESWLPLIVHPSEGVRQAVATLLARVLFTGFEQRVTAASKKAVHEMMLLVPAPFAACYRFPSDSRAVVVDGAHDIANDVITTLSVKSLLGAREQLQGGLPAVLQRLEETGCADLHGALRQIYAPTAVTDVLDCIRAAKSCSDCSAAVRLLHTRSAQFPEKWVPVLLMESLDWQQALQCCLSMQPSSGDNDTQVLSTEVFALMSIVINAGNTQHALLAAGLNVVLPALPDAVSQGGVLMQQALALVRSLLRNLEEGSIEDDQQLTVSLHEPSLMINGLATYVVSSSPSPHLRLVLQVLSAFVRSAAMRKPRAHAEGLVVTLAALVMPVIGIIIASMRVKDEAPWVCRGRGVLREALAFIRSVVTVLPPPSWQAPWAAAGATTFWLARLARDPESAVRTDAFGIVGELANPHAKDTRRMLAQAWPEVAEIMVQTALAPNIECSAVRSSALRFLISACSSDNTSTHPMDDFSTAQMLRRYAFWPRLAKQMVELRSGDVGFARAVSAMLLHAAVRDVQAGTEMMGDARAFGEIVGVMGNATDSFLRCEDGFATVGNIADLFAVLHHFGKLQEWHSSRLSHTLCALCTAFCACSSQSHPHLNPSSRLLRAYALEKIAGAAANLLSNDRLLSQLADGSVKLPPTLLRDIASVVRLEARAPHAVKMACTRFVGALMQDVDVAKAVLTSGEALLNDGDGDSNCSDAGAEVCEGLLALHTDLHSRSALVSAKTRQLQQASEGEESALARLTTDRTVCGCAVRNLLAYSSGAKRYAVEAKLIQSQLKAAETCRALLLGESLRLSVKERKADHKAKGGSKLQDKSEEANNRKLGEKEQHMLREELLMCLTLVKHAAYNGGQSDEDQPMGLAVDAAKQAALDAGVTALMLSLWPTCMIDEGLMHEVLGLLSTLLARSPSSKRAFVSDADVGHNPRRHLLAGIVKLAARPDMDVKGTRMVYGILQVLANGAESLAVLLRSNVMRDSLRLLQGYQKKCTAQQEVILRFFINVAGSPEGQRFITKSLTLAGCFDQILDIVENGGPGHAPVLALLLLRNLSFAHENKTHFVCNDRALSLLLDSLQQDAEARAYASSALWALTYKGEKVKASLKSLHAQAAITSAQELNKRASDAKQLPGTRRYFLEQAEHNLKVVSDLLEAP